VSRIIIENRSSKSDINALMNVISVIAGGKVSNNGKQHCYCTTFSNDIMVFTFLNKGSERFVVTDIKASK